MANQLIPENQFQTAVPSSDGLLTLRSTNTDSKSNSDLLDVYNIPKVTISNLEYENLDSENDLLNSQSVNEPTPILTDVEHENLESDGDLLEGVSVNEPIEIIRDIKYQTIDSDNDLITNATCIEDVPVLFHTNGTCFKNMHSESLITTKEELFVYLCEVLIRFDASPLHYQKEDYKVLIKTLVGSLIYLYDRDSTNTTVSSPPFIGLALPTTNPLAFADARHYKYPGIYLAQIPGNYEHFNINISESELRDSLILLIPDIEDELFIGYHKEIFEFILTGGNQPNNYSFRNEIMGGIVNDLNTIFTTSMPFIPGSLIIYVNGLKERDYTIDTDQQITFLIPPSRKGMIDIIEATYAVL